MGGRRRRVLGQRVSDLRRRQSPKGSRHRLPGLLLAAFGVVVFLLPASASGRPAAPTASVTPIIFGTLGANGWYVTDVIVNWVIEPLGYQQSSGCDARTISTDTADTALTCDVLWPDQTHIAVTKHFKRDATPPTVTPVPARQPDANGWYNSPLTVTFSGTDATSQIASCTQATYAGPDSPNTSISGSCRDNAGNQTAASYALKYDATPPTLGSLRVTPGNRMAKLDWNVQNATSIQVVRAPGRKGAAESVVFNGPGTAKGTTDRGLRPGRKYQYRLTATDAAANKATKTLDYLARGPLLFPAPGERVTKAPLLVWAAKKGASYYNVILVRGRRVFSAWPVQARLQLSRAWIYRGRREKLRSGTYKWFVWPGHGVLSAGKYGRLLGGSTFTYGGSG